MKLFKPYGDAFTTVIPYKIQEKGIVTLYYFYCNNSNRWYPDQKDYASPENFKEEWANAREEEVERDSYLSLFNLIFNSTRW